ncbi:MAG: M1 family metallopeptidase, partial [Candidatus Cloacimonadota bacterium]|nr:M1 family metallopeptidase [Candidatus Cloacimonadota bacterium]
MKNSMLVLVFLLNTLLFAHPVFTSPKANYNQPTRADSIHGFDVISYDISINIDDQNEFIEGTVIAQVVAEENLTEINFELEQLSINSILVDNNSVEYSYNQHIIEIPLSNINSGDLFEIVINYDGNPQQSNDVYHIGMIFNNNHIFTLSDPSGCRWWVPTYDHPWDKAIVDLHITGRDDWVAACNGIRTNIVDNDDGTNTHNWVGENPMAPHLISLVFSDMEEMIDSYEDLPIHNFFPANMSSNALEDFSLMPEMIEIYSEKFGDYPFEKYGNAVVPMVTFGAMEHQTMTTLGNAYIDGNHGGKHTIAHELAHQWFGNCLTPLTWKDVWLSEGFAVYSEAIYEREIEDFDAFVQYIQSEIQGYYKSWMTSYGPRVIYDPAYNETFYPMEYQKAASVLHMLRAKVGNDFFWEIIQTYFQTYHNSNVVTAEFIEICEEISNQDLTQFFQQWIFESGIPSVDYTYFVSNIPNTPHIKFFAKTNCSTGTQFDLSIPINLNNSSNVDSIMIEATHQITETSFFSLYDSIEFDPNS